MLELVPAQGEHFDLVEVPATEPADGQILVRNLFLSVHPAMRGWVSSDGNYSDPVPVGGVMWAAWSRRATTISVLAKS